MKEAMQVSQPTFCLNRSARKCNALEPILPALSWLQRSLNDGRCENWMWGALESRRRAIQQNQSTSDLAWRCSVCSSRTRMRSEIEKTCGVPNMSSSHTTPTDHMSYGHVIRGTGLPAQYLYQDSLSQLPSAQHSPARAANVKDVPLTLGNVGCESGLE